MVCWFAMALKGGALSWLLNLPKASIASWDGLRERFIANFQGTSDRAPIVNDLRRVEQEEGETLDKFIECFMVMRLKIPKASDEAVISSFFDGVTGLKMKEELAMNDETSTALDMFNLSSKCTKTEEGCMSLLGPQVADPEEKKAKAKEVTRKAPVVLAVKLEAKHVRGGERSSGGGPTCIFHGTSSPDTSECQELRLVHAEHFNRRPGRFDGSPAHGGGCNGGRWDDREQRQGWREQP
ncbi:hypothetical protein ZWY2020_003824 [Hordeum vulgare]|nr:hypothetical protein ZWY2020_003824 [Hordeum vulgare]